MYINENQLNPAPYSTGADAPATGSTGGAANFAWGDTLSGAGNFFQGFFTGISSFKNRGSATGSTFVLDEKGDSTGDKKIVVQQPANQTNWLLWGGIALFIVIIIVVAILLLKRG